MTSTTEKALHLDINGSIGILFEQIALGGIFRKLQMEFNFSFYN